MDVKLPSNGNVRFWWVPSNGFVNWKSPKASEILAGVPIADSISWNDLDFGIQASDTKSDPAITAKGKVTARGAGKYGGSISFYMPGAFGDTANLYNQTWELFRVPGLTGYLVERIDGEELRSATGTLANPGTDPAAGDLVHVFKVTTDAQSDSITGEDAFRYTYTFVSQGQLAPYTVVQGATAPAVTITPTTGTISLAANVPVVLTGKVDTRKYTRGLTWTSSDPTKAIVSKNGVVSKAPGATAGTVNITATYPATGTVSSAPAAITVSA